LLNSRVALKTKAAMFAALLVKAKNVVENK